MVSRVFKIFLAVDLLFLAGFSPLVHESRQLHPVASATEIYANVPTLTPTPLPTATPTPTPRRLPRRVPTQVPASGPTPASPEVAGAAQPALVQNTGGGSGDINSAMNSYRQSKGLGGLSNPGNLCGWAAQRAAEASSEFSHDKFYAHFNSGEWQGFDNMGENLYRGNISPSEIIDAWDKSSGHQENNVGNWSAGCGASSGNVAVFIFAR